MANLLQGLGSNLNDPNKNNLQMLLMSQSNPDSMLGYKLGQYISNYIDRGQERSATNALLDPQTASKITQNTVNNATTGQNLANAVSGFEALNPAANTLNKTNDVVSQISNGSPVSDWDKLASQNGSVSGNLLSGLGSNGTPTAASTTSAQPSGLGSAIGGLNSVDKLSNGQGSILDIANLAKLAGFFDPAASASQAGAASQTQGSKNTPAYVTGTNIAGMIEPGNIDIANRPVVKNADGSISTVRSMSFEVDGKEVLVPTVSDDGKIMEPQEALDNYMKTGKNLGSFDSPESADAYAQTLHKQQDAMYSTPSNNPSTNSAAPIQPAQDVPVDTAVKQAISQTLSPDPNGLLGSSANALNLVTSQPQTQQQLTPAQQLATSKIQGDIVRAKAAYQQSQANGDVAGMQQAHDMANTIRSTAQKMGLSNAILGSDSTLQDALSQKNEDDYNQQIRQIVNPDQSTQEYYNQTYNKLRDLGYGYDVANRVASQQAQSYQAKRISTLSSQFTQQGIAPTGAVNNLGAQVLTQLLNESPQAYEALSKMYATPRDDYSFNNAIKQAVTNEGLQKDLSGFSSGLHMKEADHNLGNTMQLNKQNLNNQMQLKQFEAGLSVQQKAAMDQISLKTQGLSMQQKYGVMYNAAKQFGADDETAGKYALGLMGKGNVKAPKWSEPLAASFSKAKESLDGDDVNKFVEAVAKYKPEMDGQDSDYFDSATYALNFLREKKAGNENTAAQYYNAIPDYWKGILLPGY